MDRQLHFLSAALALLLAALAAAPAPSQRSSDTLAAPPAKAIARRLVAPRATAPGAQTQPAPPDAGRAYTEEYAGLNMKMAWIEGNDAGFAAHWMGATEVTNGQYKAFLKDSGYDGAKEAQAGYLKHLTDGDDHASGDDNCPVVYVSWNNAAAFCNWLSAKTGKPYALPSEAQWEFACRCICKADAFQEANGRLDDYAWYSVNSGGKGHPVAQKRPNDWGLYDMLGNVWEWCFDLDGAGHAIRGGCWNNRAMRCDGATRLQAAADSISSVRGFRVCRLLAPR